MLTHNRTEYVLQAIQSVLDQDCDDFKFVVSDNSDDLSTYELLNKNGLLSRLDYRRRDSSSRSVDHFNLNLSEVETRYFIILHDDDVLCPDMVSTLYAAIVDSKSCVSVACNAYYLFDNRMTRHKILKIGTDIEFSTKRDFIKRYLEFSVAPMPAYIYDKSLMEGIRFTVDVGKYSDTLFYLSLLERGHILWLSRSCLNYRIHRGQDTANVDYLSQQRLMNVFRAEGSYSGNDPLFVHYRNVYLYSTMCKRISHAGRLSTLMRKQGRLLLKNGDFVLCAKFYAKYVLSRLGAFRRRNPSAVTGRR